MIGKSSHPEKPGIEDLLKTYDAGSRRKFLIICAGIVLMLILSLLFTTVGESQVKIADVLRSIHHGIAGTLTDTQEKVIVLLRLPRIALAIFAGVGLSVAGVVMQSITRNPMASPFTGGISNAAAFGASVSIVLVGIALSYLFSAATSTIEFFANEHQLAVVVQWAFGSLNGAQWPEVLVVGGLDPVYVLFSYLLFMSLILVFYAMIYMSAIKEYKFIALAYLLGMVLALICSLIMIFRLHVARYRAILYSYSIGFMFIAAFLNMLVHRNYPRKAVGYRQIFRELWHNKALALTNFCYILGLYISNFIVWNSSIRVVVANVFVNAPPYDMATCLAMFSNITAMIIFVVQVETNFHERHQHFCEMLMGGSKKAIDTSKRIVFRTLWQQVLYMAELQLIITVINFLIAMVTLRLLGFGGLTLTFYPTLTVSFYATFLMYAAIVSLYYFDDKFGSLLASVTFLIISAVGTVFMVFYVDRYEYYGMGMLIGAVAGWIVTFLRLNYLEHHIDTYIFCKGYLIPREKGNRPKSLVYHK